MSVKTSGRGWLWGPTPNKSSLRPYDISDDVSMSDYSSYSYSIYKEHQILAHRFIVQLASKYHVLRPYDISDDVSMSDYSS